MDYIDIEKELCTEIEDFIESYEGEQIETAPGLFFSMYKFVTKVDYWSSSTYLNGMIDRTGRRIPFFNILNPIVDLETRATDLDISNVSIKSDKEEDAMRNMLFSHILKQWMRLTRFGKTLNEIGETRARYGGVLVKRTERDGQLYVDVVDWSKVAVDPHDIAGGMKVETHYMTPTELWSKDGKWDNVAEAVALLDEETNETDRPQGRIKVIEVEGLFSQKYFDESAKDGKYVLKEMYIAVSDKKKVLLYEKTLKESRYKYNARKRVANRDLGRGVYEEGMEAQMWTNEGVVSMHDILSVAAKTVVLSSKNFGTNAVNELDHGQLLEAASDDRFEPVPLMANASPAYQATQALVENWFTQLQRATSAFDAVTGEQLPTSTAVRTAAIQSAQASSQFDYLREEFAFFVIEIIEDWGIHHLAKKIKNQEFFTDEFSRQELAMLDGAVAAERQHDNVKDFIRGNVPSPLTVEDLQTQVSSERASTNRRTITDMQKYFDEFFRKRNFYIHITTEQGNTAAEADNIIQAIQLLDPTDPMRPKLVDKLMQTMGVDVMASVTSATGGTNTKSGQSAIQQDVEAALPEAVK